MTDSLLNSEQEDITIDLEKNYLEELVGEGKKFKTAEDLAKGKFYADQTVDTYKKRLDELRQDFLALQADNNAKAKLEDLIDQINQNKSNSEPNPNANDNKPAFDPEQLDKLFEKKIAQHEVEKQAQTNLNVVLNKLQEVYGNNYVNVLKQKYSELGLTKEDGDALARRSPKAFFNTFGIEKQQQDPFYAPPQSRQRNDNFSPTSKTKRTWAYYQEMKKKDPSLYYDPKIGVQMAQDAVALGKEFQDGDYFKPGLHEE